MKRLCTLALGCVAVFGVACTNQQNPETAHPPGSLGAPVEREGIIYTPVSIGSQGCLLYHIKIPGGHAPAALAYQGTDGQFSYGRPDQCVKKATGSTTFR
ncbi:MAG: hypothetical protein OXI53_05225 [Nitrospira sp.]|nr:hypothetical protein [Nitrospira sp.]